MCEMVFGGDCIDVVDMPWMKDYGCCSEEVAREWLFKLEDEGELNTMPKENKGIVWVKK